MVHLVRRYWDTHPLFLIIFLAVLFRLLAVIFAKGWGMLDDHFIVIESAGSWTAGKDYNDWLPGSPANHGPTGHNLFYPGLHFLLFTFLNWIGLTDPQGKMFIVRLIHAILSLGTVYFGYRIVEMLGNRKTARLAGLLLAVFWFMPWMSVRNLVEMTSVPFLMAGYWMILRENQAQRSILPWFWAGVLFGIAFNIRPQTVFFPLGIGIIFLFQRRWVQLIGLPLGSVLFVALIQGGVDFIVWGQPFAEMLGYVNVCFTERNDYIALPWYNYFLTILALLVPPVSVFIFFGFIRSWKKYFIIFFPCLLYFIFHSYFPNKQERFILPMIPLFIAIGTLGWVEFNSHSKFWQTRKRLAAISWGFFWVVNTILLLFFTFTYSKKARVEAMTYLSKYENIQAITVLDKDGDPELMPKFYLGQWPVSYNEFAGDHSVDAVLKVASNPVNQPPSFILFTGDKNIQDMVIKARAYFPMIVHETTIEPGSLDQLVHWLNPINKNRIIYIYRNAACYPNKIEN